MAKESKSTFNLWSLLVGIVYLIVGLLAFNNPIESTGFIVYLIALTILFKGIMHFITFFQLRKHTLITNYWIIAVGIFDIIIGIFLFSNVTIGLVALPMIFSFWFIVDSVFALFIARFIRQFDKRKFYSVLVLSIISIILGILLIYNPVASLITIAYLIGSYFLINGLIHIIQAF